MQAENSTNPERRDDRAYKARQIRLTRSMVNRMAPVIGFSDDDLRRLVRFGMVRNAIDRPLEEYERAQILRRELSFLLRSRQIARFMQSMFDQDRYENDEIFSDMGPTVAGILFSHIDPDTIGDCR